MMAVTTLLMVFLTVVAFAIATAPVATVIVALATVEACCKDLGFLRKKLSAVIATTAIAPATCVNGCRGGCKSLPT